MIEKIPWTDQEDFKKKLKQVQNSNYKWYKIHCTVKGEWIEVCYE